MSNNHVNKFHKNFFTAKDGSSKVMTKMQFDMASKGGAPFIIINWSTKLIEKSQRHI